MFVGPCKGPVDFIIRGLLEASSDPSKFFVDHWISFKYVDQLVVEAAVICLVTAVQHGGSMTAPPIPAANHFPS